MPSLATRTLLNKPRSAVALTVSGNETADTFGVSRFTNTQGDGITFPGKSVGIWRAATNLTDNGNATTNTTGITDNSSTTTRVTSGTVKFGSTAFSVVSSNLAANEGPSQLINGGVGSTQYTVSAWAWLTSGAATVRATLFDSVGGKQGGTAVALTTTPQRVTVTATTGALGINEASYIETTVQAVGTWRIGGWQVETGAEATPYVETDGAGATRAIGRVRHTFGADIDETQFWLAARITPRWAGADGVWHSLFEWADDGNNGFLLHKNAADNLWRFGRFAGGAGAYATAAAGHAASESVTVVAFCNATTVKISIDGAAFTSVANTSIPTLAALTVDVGREPVNSVATALGGQLLWLALGRDALSAADAAWFHRIGTGGGVPDLYECSGDATFVWDARNAVAVRRG